MESEERKKAQELINTFWDYNKENELESCVNDPLWHAANLAQLCVDEIIKACEYNNVESWNTDWWNRVKKEIENIGL